MSSENNDSPSFKLPQSPGITPASGGRILSVHAKFSATNIPLEAFAYLAGAMDQRGRTPFHCGVVEMQGNPRQAAGRFAALYPQCQAEVFGAACDWRRPWRLISLSRWLHDWQPDVVHLHHAASAACVAVLAKRTTHARVITTMHRDFRTLTRSQRWLLRQAIDHSDIVLCNSQSTLRSVTESVPARSLPPISVMYNGVDIRGITTIIDPSSVGRNDDPGTKGTLHLGSVGRLLPIKGFDTLLRGVALLVNDGYDISVTLAGDGPERSKLAGLACDLGLKSRVQLLGAISRQEVYRRLSAMDLFVASSHSEGFCNAMVEAMSAGCPVIATEIAVFRELLGPAYPLYFAPGDAQALSERLRRCCDAPVWRQQLGASLREVAQERFSLETSAQRHAAIYRQLSYRQQSGSVNNAMPHARRAVA